MPDILLIDKSQICRVLADKEGLSISVSDNDIIGLNSAIALKPSVILLDYHLRKQETPEYISLLVKGCLTSKIVLIADQLEEFDLMDCLIAGAHGYASIEMLDRQFNKLIAAIMAGEAWISRRMVGKVLDRLRETLVSQNIKAV